MTLCPAWHALPWRHRPRGATCSPPVVTLAADEGVLPVLRVRHLQTLLTFCFCSELCPPIFASVGGSCQIALRGLCPAGSVISACLPRLLIVFSGRELAPLPSGSTQLLTWLRGRGAGLRSDPGGRPPVPPVLHPTAGPPKEQKQEAWAPEPGLNYPSCASTWQVSVWK